MSIALACTGYLDKEAIRLSRLLPQLAVYDYIVLSIPPDTTTETVSAFEHQPGIELVVNPDWSNGRYSAIHNTVETNTTHIHYADLDRLLHWIETYPTEWQATIEKIQTTDCLIIGRTEHAFQTHPQAIQQTERIINAVFSHLLGQPVDLGGGSRGFSKRATQYLIEHGNVTHAWDTDAEWLMLLHHAGFQLDYCAVDGLEARTYPGDYDEQAKRWAFRVQVALDIVQAGIAATHRGKVD